MPVLQNNIHPNPAALRVISMSMYVSSTTTHALGISNKKNIVYQNLYRNYYYHRLL